MSENQLTRLPPSGWLDLRPEVRAFALHMERKLRDNDHKGGWKECDAKALFRRLLEEAEELAHAIDPVAQRCHSGEDRGGAYADWPAVIGAEAADVANFAMMIADVSGSLSRG